MAVAFRLRNVYFMPMFGMRVCSLIFVSAVLTIECTFTDFLEHVVLTGMISSKLTKITMCNLVIVVFWEQLVLLFLFFKCQL
jgi:hypothetical protein